MTKRPYSDTLKRPQDDGPVYAHMKKILRFLWDEGPHVYEDISQVIGLSKYRTREIVAYLRHEGLVENFIRNRLHYVMVADHVDLDNENEVSENHASTREARLM